MYRTTFLPLIVLLPSFTQATTIFGPLLPESFLSPSILKFNDTFYAFSSHNNHSTINNRTLNVPVASSAHFNYGWSLLQNVDALPDAGPWTSSRPEVTSPDVSELPDKSFILYYAAHPASSPYKHCIGAATSKTVTGPYTPQSLPLICSGTTSSTSPEDGGEMGPNFLRFKKKNYLVYRNVTTSSSNLSIMNSTNTNTGVETEEEIPPHISLTEVSSNGLSIDTLKGKKPFKPYEIDILNGTVRSTSAKSSLSFPIQSIDDAYDDEDTDADTDAGLTISNTTSTGLFLPGPRAAALLINPHPGHKSAGKFVLLFTGGSGNGSRIDYATASKIQGPYQRKGPLLQAGAFNVQHDNKTTSVQLRDFSGVDVLKQNSSRIIFEANQIVTGTQMKVQRRMFAAELAFDKERIIVL